MADSSLAPPIRNLPQWDGRWGKKILHDAETWQASGCHPSCVAMVLRWYAEDNPATKGTFQFPAKSGSSIDTSFYPLRMAEAFWPSLSGKVNAISNNVDHNGLMKAAAAALGIDPGGVQLSLSGDRLQTIQDALAKGPIVVNMTKPGHFVVIQGYVGGKLIIVDPGNELCKKKGTTTSVSRPPASQWPGGAAPSAGNEYDGRAYVSIDPAGFVSGLIRMELYTCNAVSSTTTHHATTTAAPASSTTAAPAADAPAAAAPADTSTAAPAETSTAAPADTTTAAPSNTTTSAGAGSSPSTTTTAPPADSTTAAPADSTTAAPAGSTTAAPDESTTASPGDSTTAQPGTTTTQAPGDSTTAAPGDSTTAAPGNSTTAAPGETTTASGGTTTTAAAGEGAAIACDDEVRAAADLQPWDLQGNEGRWLEVPRLQQQNDDAPSQSSFWSGRAAAAMIHNFWSKFAKKTDEYIAHADGDVAPGPNGIKTNLRWLGGANKGVLAGLTDGQVDLTQIFTAASLKFDAGMLVPADAAGDPAQASLYFQPILDQLKTNNPVLLFTLLSRGPGHVIVISGYKIVGNGDLWIRVTDSDGPRSEYLPDLEPITNPTAPDKMFSEYWVPATAFFAAHPSIEGAKLYEYVGNAGKFMYVIPDSPVTDDDELVHLLTPNGTPDGTGDGGGTGDGSGDGTADGSGDATGGDGTGGDATGDAGSGSGDGTGGGSGDAPQPRPWDVVEPEVVSGAFKDAGVWKDGKFTNIDLQGLLEHYCTADSISPSAMGDGGASKSAKGGDLPVGADDSLPTWYCTWRVKVAMKPKWDSFCVGRSRVGEAFSRWFFRDLCKQKGLAYPLSADEFFANLWKSSANGKSPDMGGPSGIYCAAASSLAFERALLAAGYKVPDAKGTQCATQNVLGQLKKIKPAPGDVLSLVGAGTPRTGHVVTLIVPLSSDFDSGSHWVVSGNCSPKGNVAVDLINVEARDPQFNPFKTVDGALLSQWQANDKKPSAGKVWIYADQQCSELMPEKLGSLSDADLKKHFLSKCTPVPTPGSTPGTVKPTGDDSAGAGAGSGDAGSGSGDGGDAPSETTTEAASPSETTTEAASGGAPESTTTAPGITTTAAPSDSTTAAPGNSTTQAPANSTTVAPSGSTTAAPSGSTTTAPASTTTHSHTTTHPPSTTTHSPDKMTGSNIQVNGKHFVDWFNQDFRPQYPGNHPTLLLWKKPAPMFPANINKANFIKVFDKLDKLWAPQMSLLEFFAFFGIFYNETGGTMQPVGEKGSAKYMFNATPGGKASYNTGGNRKAGDQLAGGDGPYKGNPQITDPNEIKAWNGTVYPDSSSDAVKQAALQCDFYKYRGHGFIQTTFRNAYLSTVDPALQAAGIGKKSDDMTAEELESTIGSNPDVSLPMVKSYYKANCSKMMANLEGDPPNWTPIGTRVSGQKPYGELFQWRCQTIYEAMKKAGYKLS